MTIINRNQFEFGAENDLNNSIFCLYFFLKVDQKRGITNYYAKSNKLTLVRIHHRSSRVDQLEFIMLNWLEKLKNDLKYSNSDLELLIGNYLNQSPASITDNIDCDIHAIARWDRSCTLPRNRIVREALMEISSSKTFGDFFIPNDEVGLSWIAEFLCGDFSKKVFKDFKVKIQYNDIPGFNCHSKNAAELIEGVYTIIFIKNGVAQQLTPDFFESNNVDSKFVVAKMRNGCDINTCSVKKIRKDAIILGLQEIIRQLLFSK